MAGVRRRALGVLFQIVDDILDATGTAEELGKMPGKDEAAGKLTYVSLHGLERARELADEARGRASTSSLRACRATRPSWPSFVDTRVRSS